MGARGELRLVAPDGKPDTEGTAAALAKPDVPNKPDDLDETISALWDELVEPLAAAGMLGGMDGPTLVLALEHYSIARRAADTLRRDGLTVFDAKNEREARHPAGMILNSSTEAFLKIGKELGLSFVSRARIDIAAKKEENEGNPFA